jgi:hypothetical protein
MRTYYHESIRPSAKSDIRHFKQRECELCKTRNNLQEHTFNGEFLCDDCIEQINNDLRAAEYHNVDLNELQQEREA